MSKRRKMNRSKVERQADIEGATESAETKIITRFTTSEDPLRDELLLGIPNEVTLNHIATLLPRSAYEEVAKVNPEWQRAFQGRMVYDARVRSKRTQTFLVVLFKVSRVSVKYTTIKTVEKQTVSLFSPSEERWYKFPPIPGCREGMLRNCLSVLLDGSIYLLGGMRSRKNIDIPSAEVRVLDFAGHPLEWRRCANMQALRLHPQISVMHGKIFVFGGVACSGDFQFEVRNEVYDPKVDAWSFTVYDPKVDAWSFTAPTMPSASIHLVFSVGQQFFACTGWMSRPRNLRHAPVIDGEAELYCNTKYVIKVDDRGPKLIKTSDDDDDAEDDTDGLQEVFQNQLVDDGRRRPVDAPFRCSPAELLENIYTLHSGTESFFGFYDPVKDEWRAFERDSLGRDNLDDGRPEKILDLRPWQHDSRPYNYYYHEFATASVRSISL